MVCLTVALTFYSLKFSRASLPVGLVPLMPAPIWTTPTETGAGGGPMTAVEVDGGPMPEASLNGDVILRLVPPIGEYPGEPYGEEPPDGDGR
jgi:hypothetical protein